MIPLMTTGFLGGVCVALFQRSLCKSVTCPHSSMRTAIAWQAADAPAAAALQLAHALSHSRQPLQVPWTILMSTLGCLAESTTVPDTAPFPIEGHTAKLCHCGDS